MHRCHLAPVPHLRARASPAAIGKSGDDEAGYVSAGPHLKVGPAVTGRAQKGFRGVPAPTVLLIDLEVPHAFIAAAIEIAAARNTGLRCGLRERIENVPAQPLLLDSPLAAGRMVSGELRVRAAAEVMILVLPESGQDLGPAPGIIAGELGPVIVVA